MTPRGHADRRAVRRCPEVRVPPNVKYLKSAWLWGMLSALAWHATSAAAAGCTQPSAPIATDRPDVTNSSVVVPVGSLQNENGINVSRRDGADIFDGTNSR